MPRRFTAQEIKHPLHGKIKSFQTKGAKKIKSRRRPKLFAMRDLWWALLYIEFFAFLIWSNNPHQDVRLAAEKAMQCVEVMR